MQVTSPPYNVGKSYETKTSIEKYLETQEEIINELVRFSKSDDYIFNLDNVRVPSKYEGKRNFKGSKKGQPSGNPLGKNPSDLEIIQQGWDSAMWEFQTKNQTIRKNTKHFISLRLLLNYAKSIQN